MFVEVGYRGYGPTYRATYNIVVVEAHCYAPQCRRIDCEQIHSRINQPLIAGRFGPKAFLSCIQNVLYAADESLRAETSCN